MSNGAREGHVRPVPESNSAATSAAFPRPYPGIAGAVTLRDYFAAHAPAEPWPHFQPLSPPMPLAPERNIQAQTTLPESLTDEQIGYVVNLASGWQSDPCFDLEGYRVDGSTADFTDAITAARSALNAYERSWRTYWNDHAQWEKHREAARYEQWPWFYADTMLAEREAPRGRPR